jgi:hypothetical protein
MSSPARRDDVLYESDAALRLVDRAIQELRITTVDEESETVAVAVAEGDAETDAAIGE